MASFVSDIATAISPLEQFVRDDVEASGGAWDEVEPQVYDLLLPPAVAAASGADQASPVVRVTFDPEALADHPQSQLASWGTPLVDRMLTDALERGRFVDLHLLGLNLHPQQLASRLIRALRLPAGTGLEIRRIRPLDFPQLVLWFEAEFLCDQRELEILPLTVDLHYGREVRHLELLLDESRLSETSSQVLPQARGVGRARAYLVARQQVLRTVTTLANLRARELAERLDKQTARLARYYDDLEREVDEQARRAASRDEVDDRKWQSRRTALTQERQMRIAELRAKSTLQVRLRLLNALLVHQPKLAISVVASEDRPHAKSAQGEPAGLSVVWDPLVEAVEPAPCAACGRPTFELAWRQASLVCSACGSATASSHRPR